MSIISEEKKREFDTNGYIILKNTLDNTTINKSIFAIDNIRAKCENYIYLFFRKFHDIALNDIYGIEHIFHPEIFDKEIFSSLMKSKVLEKSRELLNDENIFLSRNRIHCTNKISHSGYWHRDGTAGETNDMDDQLKKSEKDIMWVQATLPYYYEDGFYVIPGSHKFSKDFIPSKEILGTKKILKNELRLELFPGDLLLFNPFLIHRGTCAGGGKRKRAHVHMRFARKKYSKFAERYRKDKVFFKKTEVYNTANESWKKSFDLDLEDPIIWYGDEIIQKKPNMFTIKFYLKILLILYNRLLYNLSRFYPFSQRSLENFSLIKYPFLKRNKLKTAIRNNQ